MHFHYSVLNSVNRKKMMIKCWLPMKTCHYQGGLCIKVVKKYLWGAHRAELLGQAA